MSQCWTPDLTLHSVPLTFTAHLHESIFEQELEKEHRPPGDITTSASDVRNGSRRHCWKEKHAGFGVHHKDCELSKACRVCTLILFYFMAGGYFHDCASPVCPINLQSSHLWHQEGTFSPYLPVQLSPLLWRWQWDTVRLARSSVTFHSAREYLHKARAAVRQRKINTPHNHKAHTYRRVLCACASTFNQQGWQEKWHGVKMYNYSQLLVNGCWVIVLISLKGERVGEHPNSSHLLHYHSSFNNSPRSLEVQHGQVYHMLSHCAIIACSSRNDNP